MVRCFIGVFVPFALKECILPLQKYIKSSHVDCKLVEYENLHITLSFLGDVAESRIDLIKNNLDLVAKRFNKFVIGLSGVKFIPSVNFVRVIGLDIIDSNGLLRQIMDEIKTNVGGDVKPPHLTLCRVKNFDKTKVVSKLLNLDSNCGDFEINSLSLIKSELKFDGPVYSTLHKSKLLE